MLKDEVTIHKSMRGNGNFHFTLTFYQRGLLHRKNGPAVSWVREDVYEDTGRECHGGYAYTEFGADIRWG